MSGKPAATVGSNHTCPMCSGTTPHVGGPITQGEPTILFNGNPVASVGSLCTCIGPPDMIVQGNPTVLVNGQPIACVGDMTAHGGVIVSGSPNIIIGSNSPKVPTAIMPITKIPFPEITLTNRLLGNAKEAIANQDKIRKMSELTEGDKRVYGLQWIKEETVIRESKALREVTLRASVLNIPDGQTASITITKPIKLTDEKGKVTSKEEEIVVLTGTVKDKSIEVVWQIEDTEEETTN